VSDGQARNVMDLYRLLPDLYQLRDAEQGYPLRAFLEIISEQVDILHRNIGGLWDDFFIETCDRWVIPYIGELVANNLLHDSENLTTPDTATDLFGDLLGPDLRPPIAVRIRADVAKTIYYRRRKGTAPMLEELARDITGWGARVVEFFELLEWNQHLSHLRLHSHETAELRNVDVVDRLDGPFDQLSHSADVRPIGQTEGWHNIRNVGFFLWRLKSYSLEDVPARQVDPPGVPDPWRFHFCPLGHPAPLFSYWRRKGDQAGLAREVHVPCPIRRAFFYEDLQAYRRSSPVRPDTTELYGPIDDERSFHVSRNGSAVAASSNPDEVDPAAVQMQIVCRQLRPWPTSRPTGQVIAVDPVEGRIAVGNGWGNITTSLDVSYTYGFSSDLGGGPYPRQKWLLRRELPDVHFRVKQDGTVPPGQPPVTHTSLQGALGAWQANPHRNTLIEILDSRTFRLRRPPPDTALPLQLSNEHWLVIEAASGQRPVLRTRNAGLDIDVLPPAIPGAEPEGALTLSGVAVEGWLRVVGNLGRLRLLHSTLVPGRRLEPDQGDPVTTEPSLVALPGPADAPLNTRLRAEIAFCITGPLRLPDHARGLWILDSIVDGIRQAGDWGTAIAATATDDQPGPPATLERVTFFGPTYFKRLPLASEVIFTRPVTVQQRQDGCIRFSYVAPETIAPRRYRCQPQLEIADQIQKAEEAAGGPIPDPAQAQIAARVSAWLQPGFSAVGFGRPDYAQLRLNCPVQIRTGAEDGSEMGAFSHLKQPQREGNLRIRLQEYLPFGLEPGLIYVT